MKKLVRISAVILLVIMFSSCKKDKLSPPFVTTVAVSEISYTTATSGGDVTNEGGSPVLSRGVCWNTTGNPTISESRRFWTQ